MIDQEVERALQKAERNRRRAELMQLRGQVVDSDRQVFEALLREFIALPSVRGSKLLANRSITFSLWSDDVRRFGSDDLSDEAIQEQIEFTGATVQLRYEVGRPVLTIFDESQRSITLTRIAGGIWKCTRKRVKEPSGRSACFRKTPRSPGFPD